MNEFFTEWLPWIVTVASMVTATMPAPQNPVGKLIIGFIRYAALNIGNAKPEEKPKRFDVGPMAVLVLLFGFGAMPLDSIAATLSWDLPTTYVNDEPLPAADITAITIYRDDVLLVALPGNATNYTVPDCKEAFYRATATANGLESAKSGEAYMQPLAVNCAPKPPSGLRF